MSTVEISSVKRHSPSESKVLVFISKYGILLAMGVMIAVFGILSPTDSFLTYQNFVNILDQSALTAIIACGLTIVLVVGEFDLSIGYASSLAGILVAGLVVQQNLPLLLAIIITLSATVVIGVVNGLLVTKARINSVVATLGIGTIIIGLSFGYTSGSPIVSVPDSFLNMAMGTVFGVHNPIALMVVVLIVLWIILNRTPLGQKIQAVGGNVQAARLAGIRTDRIKIAAFVIAGICAGITGIMLASYLGSGTVGAADSYLMDSFAAVFLGSAAFRDGEFHIVGTLLGVLVVNVGFNGLSQVGTPTFWQYIFKGGILVLAVALSTISRKYSKKGS